MPTEAQTSDQVVRRHLAAVIVLAQEGTDAAVLRMMRAETCRLVSAICVALGRHPLDAAGLCPVCAVDTCHLRKEIRQALLPINI
jgi:hypothetical protein